MSRSPSNVKKRKEVRIGGWRKRSCKLPWERKSFVLVHGLFVREKVSAPMKMSGRKVNLNLKGIE